MTESAKQGNSFITVQLIATVVGVPLSPVTLNILPEDKCSHLHTDLRLSKRYCRLSKYHWFNYIFIYIYIYIYIDLYYICMYVSISTYVCMYLSVCMYVRTYLRMYICTYLSAYVCTYLPICVCMYVCIYLSIYLSAYVCIYAYLSEISVCLSICSKMWWCCEAKTTTGQAWHIPGPESENLEEVTDSSSDGPIMCDETLRRTADMKLYGVKKGSSASVKAPLNILSHNNNK